MSLVLTLDQCAHKHASRTQCPVIDCIEVHGSQILTLCLDALCCFGGVLGPCGHRVLGSLAKTPLFLLMSQLTFSWQMVAQSSAAKKTSMLKEDLLYMWRGYLWELLSLLASVVPRGGGAAGCSDLRTPQAPHHDSARHPDGTACQLVSFRGRGG